MAYGGINGIPYCSCCLLMILASSMWEGPTPNILLPLSANIKPSKLIEHGVVAHPPSFPQWTLPRNWQTLRTLTLQPQTLPPPPWLWSRSLAPTGAVIMPSPPLLLFDRAAVRATNDRDDPPPSRPSRSQPHRCRHRRPRRHRRHDPQRRRRNSSPPPSRSRRRRPSRRRRISLVLQPRRP